MPGFNAGAVVEKLEYDFSAFGGGSGVIAEPSDKLLGDFMAGLKDIAALAQKLVPDLDGIPDDPAPADIAVVLDQLDTDSYVQVMEKMAALHSALCSGTPAEEDILRVPPRIRMLFYGWLQREVMNPEPLPGAGKTPQVTRLRPAAG